MHDVRHQFSVRDAVASKFIRYDLSGFALVTLDYPLEEPLGSCPIPLRLQEDIQVCFRSSTLTWDNTAV